MRRDQGREGEMKEVDREEKKVELEEKKEVEKMRIKGAQGGRSLLSAVTSWQCGTPGAGQRVGVAGD